MIEIEFRNDVNFTQQKKTVSCASSTRLGSNEKHMELRKTNDNEFIQPPVIVVKRNKSVKVALAVRKVKKEIDQDK